MIKLKKQGSNRDENDENRRNSLRTCNNNEVRQGQKSFFQMYWSSHQVKEKICHQKVDHLNHQVKECHKISHKGQYNLS